MSLITARAEIFLKRASIKNAVRLLLGNSGAQAFVLLATILSATWLSADDFAYFGLAIAASALLNSFNTLGVENLIAVTASQDLEQLVKTALLFALMVSLVLICMVWALNDITGQSVAISLALACVAALVVALQQMTVMEAIKQADFQSLSAARLTQGVVNGLLIMTSALQWLPGFVILTLAWMFSGAIALVPIRKHLASLVPADWSLPVRGALRSWRASSSLGLTGFLSTASVNGPLFLLPLVAPVEIAGTWAFTTRILGAAAMATFSVLQPMYYSSAAAIARENAWTLFQTHFLRWSKRLFVVAGLVLLAGLIALWIGSDWLYGRSYSPAVVAICSIFWSAQAFGLPTSQTLVVIGATRVLLVWAGSRFLVLAAILSLIPLAGYVMALQMWVGAIWLFYLLLAAIHVRQITSRLALSPEKVVDQE